MNWVSLALVAAKYLPVIIDFVQKEGPAVQAFVKDVEAALAQSPAVAPGAVAPAAVIPQLQQLGTILPQLLGQLQSGRLNLPGGFTS